MTVYFVQIGNADRVKIGFSGNLKNRLQSMATVSSEVVTLLGHIEGDKKMESDLHTRFASYRIRGEWFHLSGDLLAYVLSLPPISLPEASGGATNLAKCLAARQRKYDVSSKELSKEVGLSESSLCRIKKGKFPDAQALAKLMIWMTSPACSISRPA